MPWICHFYEILHELIEDDGKMGSTRDSENGVTPGRPTTLSREVEAIIRFDGRVDEAVSIEMPFQDVGFMYNCMPGGALGLLDC